MAVRIRRDLWKLSAASDPALEWYAKAVFAMKQLPATDPKSWWYQAGVHGHNLLLPVWHALLPLPAGGERSTYWDQCQHGNWHFFSWHRIYLAVFEQLIGQNVVALGGPADWALPFWNYSDAGNAQATTLPPEFTAAAFAGMTPNPLLEPRLLGTAARPQLQAVDVALGAMGEPNFDSGPFGGSGFGGRRPGSAHHGGNMGALESVPHGSVHVGVGGVMRDPDTAALDPIFWLHHSNIDRLWEKWLHDDAAHNNPTDPGWLNQLFDFRDQSGAAIQMKAADVLDTTKVMGGYVYEGLPNAAGVLIQGDLDDMAQGDGAMATTEVPEMVGATASPTALGGQATNVDFELHRASGPVASVLDAGTVPDVFLNFENVTSKGLVDAYDVYVNVPDGDTPQQHPEQLAGVLPMFGVVNASEKSRGGTGDGLHYTLRITRLVESLWQQNAWNWKHVYVTLVPREQPAGDANLKVGRISVYLQ